MNELELATTNELLDELGRRFKGVVVCAIEHNSPSEGDDSDSLKFYIHGGLTLCMGLADRMVTFVDHQSYESMDDLEDATDEPAEDESD